jgi:hypothetical protein
MSTGLNEIGAVTDSTRTIKIRTSHLPSSFDQLVPAVEYNVLAVVLQALEPFVGPPPAEMHEGKLIDLLKRKCVAYSKRSGDTQGCLIQHMTNCANDLSLGNHIKQREMIGEILGAVRVRMLWPTWHMVVGYAGGHTGIDQIWTDGFNYLIVECKGGTGSLSDRQVYFEGCTHQGQLGMNDKVTQMSKPWVFMGCNDKLLGQRFGAAMISDTPFDWAFMHPYQKHALRICLALWDPTEDLVQLGHRTFTYKGGRGMVAPTRRFNGLMGWTPGESVIQLPTVAGIVVVNGMVAELFEYAKARPVIAEPKPEERKPPDGQGGGGGGGPHRFQPGVIPTLQQNRVF